MNERNSVIILYMRHSFTRTMSAAIADADGQARKLGQEFVGAEHLFLGVLAGESGEALRAIKSQVELKDLESELRRMLPRSANPAVVTGRLPFSPKAQAIINTAISDAQNAGESVVSTRWLLLAMLGEGDSPVDKALSSSGADVEELRRNLRQSQETSEK